MRPLERAPGFLGRQTTKHLALDLDLPELVQRGRGRITDENIAATLRASFYIYNSVDEVDALVDALATARKVYQRKAS